MEFKENIFEHAPEYNSIEFKSKWTSMEVSSVDIGGNVEIEINNDGDMTSIFLNQENLKHLIKHLQKQIKS